MWMGLSIWVISKQHGHQEKGSLKLGHRFWHLFAYSLKALHVCGAENSVCVILVIHQDIA